MQVCVVPILELLIIMKLKQVHLISHWVESKIVIEGRFTTHVRNSFFVLVA
jgi:uncharacterized protein YPO0396